MSVSAPALAQTAPAQSMTPQSTQSVPATSDSTAMQAAQPADSASAPAQDAAAAQPVAATQVADVVTKEFPTYDKNGDGNLNAKEFDTWMVALKTASDPSTKATSPATKTWLNQAFAQADADKNKKVSQSELTGFLSQKG
ncbi:EF-hand domain-containing protein [Sphingomonas sp. MMS24-J45]|uniref:EF-hand domain-containing protein n=1 Tax=Sphingomonas sp. MMS24-J45 TaxID=3238806 RepID=UPI00385179E0